MKKHPYLFLLCFTLLYGVAGICLAQNSTSFIPAQTQASPQEKIYIHYDKSNYLLGDTVWFKAYLFNGSERSKLSRNFYFELVNYTGKIVQRVTAPVFESTASGNFVIPIDTAATGLYCRVYTTYMLKDTGFLYTQALNVTNLHKRVPLQKANVSIRFLPEGGNWINGLPCVMAFKVTDDNGLPIKVSGSIKSNNKTITEFSTRHNGMGAFTIIPQDGQDYMAFWKDNAGTEHISPLPEPQTQGIGLHVNDTADGKMFFIFRSSQITAENKNLALIASINNIIIYRSQVNLTTEQGANGIIPTRGLPSGILHITLYNKNSGPVAERVTFVNNHNYTFNIDTNISILNKGNRGLNKIRIAIKDTLRTNLSVAVTDAHVDAASVYRDNIVSHLLLTGDLRGKIIDPYYYFTKSTDTTARDLDLVMLTNGWRKYNWEKPKEVITGNNFLSVDGKVTGINLNAITPNNPVNIIIQSADSSSVLVSATVGKDGRFFTDGIIFYGNAILFFKFSDKNLISNNVKITARNGLQDSLNIPGNSPGFWSTGPTQNINMPKLLADRTTARNSKMLKEVLIKGVKEPELEKLDKTYATGLFKNGISKNFNVGNDPKAMHNLSLFQYLQGKVPGLLISNAVSGYPSLLWRNEKVYLYLNNFPVAAGDIRNISMAEFDYVKIYDPASGGMFGVFGGVIAVYTKNSKTGFAFNDKNSKTLTLTGYTPVKEFYSPDYATTVTTTTLSDLRTTLYWNPNIILDKEKHEYLIKFYNNDVTRKFKIVLEGMNFDGKLVHLEKEL